MTYNHRSSDRDKTRRALTMAIVDSILNSKKMDKPAIATWLTRTFDYTDTHSRSIVNGHRPLSRESAAMLLKVAGLPLDPWSAHRDWKLLSPRARYPGWGGVWSFGSPRTINDEDDSKPPTPPASAETPLMQNQLHQLEKDVVRLTKENESLVARLSSLTDVAKMTDISCVWAVFDYNDYVVSIHKTEAGAIAAADARAIKEKCVRLGNARLRWEGSDMSIWVERLLIST